MARNLNVRNAVKLALAVNAGLVGLSAAPGAIAQEGAGELEEITVTGSRIKKKDFTSNAPVATVGFEQIELTGTVNTESLLNTLPQTVPGLDRTSNNPGNGTATVDLRGLGSNRTLVLINGTRVVPTTSGGSVDINSIPNALIQNIEVLTGGASAVYGSDAVAGVVNFILKDDFEGIAVNAGYEQTFEGDAGLFSTDLTIGANIADGRGNVVFNMAYTDRDDLFQGDRDFSAFDLNDNAGRTALEAGGSPGIPSLWISEGGFETSGFSPDTSAVTFEPDGSMRPFVASGTPNDYYNFAPVNYIQLPQERWQGTALGHFDITDNATVYGRFMFTQSNVPQQLAPTPAYLTVTATLDDNPFLTDQAKAEFDAAGLGDGNIGPNGFSETATFFQGRRMTEVGPRIAESTSNSFQLQAGVRGDITDSWGYDGYIQQGRVNFNEAQRGNISRARFAQALLLDPDDNTQCADTSGGCVPMNIFGAGNISQEAADFVSVRVNSAADYQQTIGNLTFSGDLGPLALPGGAIGAAFGVEYRDEEFRFDPSQDLATGNIAGFNGAPPIEGDFDVTSYFAELYLPILSGAPFADLLDMELAYRTEDYSTSGTVDAYKVSASWAPIADLRFRGGYNRAVRAPSIGELFSPQGQNAPAAVDPCSQQGNPDAATAAICTATGVPSGAINSAAINTPAGQVFAISGGNPELQPETADTYTFGFVVQPSAIEGLSVSLDYFDIEITDYITEFGGGANNVLSVCYDASNPAGGDPTNGLGPDSPFCQTITRGSSGIITEISLQDQNVATQTLKGFDLLASYDFDLFGGDARIGYVATYTTESDFLAFEGDTPIECAGNFGNDCGEPLPEYKHRANFRWTGDKITGQLLWRMVGEANDDDPDIDYVVDSIDTTHYFDASGTYRFSDNWWLTVGIDNLLDESPPILGSNDEQSNTWPATYDVFGRTFFLRASAEF